MLTTTHINTVPVQTGIGELLCLECAWSVIRGVSTQANRQDHATDATKDEAFPEEAGEQLQSNADRASLSQEAGGMSRNITIAKNAIIAGVMGVGGMVFVSSLIYAALLSRLE